MSRLSSTTRTVAAFRSWGRTTRRCSVESSMSSSRYPELRRSSSCHSGKPARGWRRSAPTSCSACLRSTGAESGGARGSSKARTDPRPSSLVAEMVPPCSSTSSRARDRPIPVPPNRRVLELSTWWNRSKIRSRSASGMPIPVSWTSTRRPSARSIRRTRTSPRSGVNFTALPSRFRATRSRWSRSAWIIGMGPLASKVSLIRLRPASGRTWSTSSSISRPTSTGPSRRRRLAVSARASSSRSSISLSSRSAFRSASRRLSRCPADRFRGSSSRDCIGASARVSGVRSSWLRFAKNRLLARSRAVSFWLAWARSRRVRKSAQRRSFATRAITPAISAAARRTALLVTKSPRSPRTPPAIITTS